MRGLIVLLLGSAFILGALASVADAARDRRGIEVVQAEGFFDPPVASLLLDAIERVNARRSTLLVIQLDSGGAVDADPWRVVRAIRRSRVPVVVWVGPPGAEARGAAAVLLQAAHGAYVAQGASVGPAAPVRLDEPGSVGRARVARRVVSLADTRARDSSGARQLLSSRLDSLEAFNVGVVDAITPTVGEVIVQLDGDVVRTAAGDVELDTAKVVIEGSDLRRTPNQEVVFDSLGLGGSLLHALINPSVAYGLFVAGLALLVFEFFTASIGLAGLSGALAVVGACYGFSHLPLRWWACALLLLATFGYAIEVQAGGTGPWTAIATTSLVGGSFGLYGGSSRLGPPWWGVLVVVVGVLLFNLAGMTAMVHARFSSPAVGREGMIGTEGTAEVAVDPEGVVVIRGARWRARTSRATPIEAGGSARVVAIEGVVLQVEPTVPLERRRARK